jgi:spermidine synthase
MTRLHRLASYVLVSLLLAGSAAAEWRVVFDKKSPFSKVSVRENDQGLRQLIFDDGTAVQSAMNINRPDELVLSYSKHEMTVLPLIEKPRRILIVGLGGGSMPRFIHRLLPDVRIDNVEIDPVVVEAATKFFFFKEDERMKVYVGDGRKFIEDSKDTYDIIYLDAFGADFIPYSLATREFLNAVKARLADGGVVASNLWSDEPTYPSMIKTYASVFPELHVIRCRTSGNVIVLACGTRMNLDSGRWIGKAKAFDTAHTTKLDLADMIDQGYRPLPALGPEAKVLLDKDDPKK